MITVIPRILSMAQPMATAVPVSGLETVTATEFLLDGFRPSPEGTIRFPEIRAMRIDEARAVLVLSGKRILLTNDTIEDFQLLTNLMLIDAGRMILEKWPGSPKDKLKNQPLKGTPNRPWRVSTWPLREKVEFPTAVSFEDGLPARDIPMHLELEEQPQKNSGVPLRRILIELEHEGSDQFDLTEAFAGMERCVTVYVSPDRLTTYYDFRWSGTALEGLRNLFGSPRSLRDLAKEIEEKIRVSGLYEAEEMEPKEGVMPAFDIGWYPGKDGEIFQVDLNPSEKNDGRGSMPLPPSLRQLFWKGRFDLGD